MVFFDMALKSKLMKYKNCIIPFFILGIPFFVGFYLTISFNEYYCSIHPIVRKSLRLLEFFVVFLTLYLSYLYNITLRKIVLLFWSLLIYVPVALEFICAKFTGTLISPDFMSTILVANVEEAIYSLKEYAPFILVNLCVVISAFFMRSPKKSNKKYAIYSVMLLLVSFSMSEFLPHNNIVAAISEYMDDIREAKLFNEVRTPLIGIENHSSSKKQMCILVIGESVDRNHMGIYGYERQTTPYFCDIRDELAVFKNVRTAYGLTNMAIKSISRLNILGKKHYTFINFFKDAGFKTFWLSNQIGADIFDNYVLYLGKSCDESVFISDKNPFDRTPFDIELIEPLKKVLADKSEKKLIVIHLLGSHFPMELRYPSDFSKFKCSDSISDSVSDAKKNRNTCYYDNSILYTDYVLNEIIKLLKEKEDESICFLYVSDHGQEICGDERYESTTRGGTGTYEIPFVVWTSDKYRQENAIFINEWDTSMPYVTDKMAYSIIDLARMSHPLVDLANSIFSSVQKNQETTQVTKSTENRPKIRKK